MRTYKTRFPVVNICITAVYLKHVVAFSNFTLCKYEKAEYKASKLCLTQKVLYFHVSKSTKIFQYTSFLIFSFCSIHTYLYFKHTRIGWYSKYSYSEKIHKIKVYIHRYVKCKRNEYRYQLKGDQRILQINEQKI